MSFMIKKKKYRFKVDLELQELSAVPFVNGILFAKVRLLDGGTFLEMSPRHEVKNNCVKWNSRFQFGCKMTANANTGILESCICRVSVRKEVKGGRTFEKLGFANLNLAEFAGAGLTSKRYLLEGYDAKHRQDNSMLQVTVEMVLLAGDPCFKTPISRHAAPTCDKPDIQVQVIKSGEDNSGDSLGSGSSGIGSLPRKPRTPGLSSDITSGGAEEKEDKDDEEHNKNEFELGHSRNSSSTSQQSKVSGYSSLPSHSRQGSAESGHQRNLSSSSTFSELGLSAGAKVPDRKRPSKKQGPEDSRMDYTRVNAKSVINEVIEATNLDADETSESAGLTLSSFIKTATMPSASNSKASNLSSTHSLYETPAPVLSDR